VRGIRYAVGSTSKAKFGVDNATLKSRMGIRIMIRGLFIYHGQAMFELANCRINISMGGDGETMKGNVESQHYVKVDRGNGKSIFWHDFVFAPPSA
jgi:hypothetical protein